MIPSGTIYLCKNAVVDTTYNHTIDFKSSEEQRLYWSSLVKYTISDTSYIRRQRPFLKVDKPLDSLQDVNYLYYKAKENSKFYYCFVTSKEWVAEDTTYIYFEVDVIQTYLFDYKLKESYVLQEHTDRWNTDKTPIYSRTDEGLNYGEEYTVESAYKIISNLEEDTSAINPNNKQHIRWYLALCSTHGDKVEGDTKIYGDIPTNIWGSSNPYIIYLLPSFNLVDKFTFVANGGDTSTIDGVTTFLRDMGAEGSSGVIQQIFKINYLPFDVNYKVADGNISINIGGGKVWHDIVAIKGKTELGTDTTHHYLKLSQVTSINFLGNLKLAEMDIFTGIDNAMPTAEQWADVKANPRTTTRDKRFESKLLTYPYRYNLLTDWKSTPSVIKNEYLAGDKITVKYSQGIGFNGVGRFWIDNYRKDLEGRGNALYQLTSEELPIVSDAYYSYMLANRNQIEANKTNAVTSSLANVGQSLIGGAIFGGGVGAIQGAVGGAISGAVNYTNMVRTENSKQKDLKNLPDTIINSNDGNFNSLDGNEYLTFYRMKICCEFEEMLADAFHLTGYTIKRVKLPNLKSRTRFNYIKTAGANIVGSFDQNDLTKIKAIFDNGITFWHYSERDFNPLDYSYENIETSLL